MSTVKCEKPTRRDKSMNDAERTRDQSKCGPEEMQSAVGVCYDEFCLKHMKDINHCENPQRIESIQDYFTTKSPHNQKQILVKARLATQEECLWVHSEKHVDAI